MAAEVFAGIAHEVGPQNPAHPHSYAWNQRTKEKVVLCYFCGGEADGWVLVHDDLLSLRLTGWLSITDYTWTPFIVGNDSDYPARVWESNHLHACTKGDYIPMPAQQLSVIQQVWAEVDAAYFKFNNDNTMTDEAATHLKGYMRGLCTGIRILMNPRFSSDDDVVAEVHKRHIMKTAGAEYVTPGVGEPLDVDRLMQPVTNSFAKTNSAPALTPKHDIPEETVVKLRAARAAGISDADLCNLYGIRQSVLASL